MVIRVKIKTCNYHIIFSLSNEVNAGKDVGVDFFH